MARGLPMEGERAGERRAIHFATMDVVTGSLTDTVGSLRDRVRRSPRIFALVIGAGGAVLGRVGSAALDGDPERSAEQAMSSGPKTYRPHLAPGELLDSLRERELTTAILTDPEGRLLGVVARDALEPPS
jgi:hypothetical protein